MTLPRLLLVTDRHKMQPSFEAALEAALRGGARLIQLREKDLPPRDVFLLALRAQRLCEKHGASLLINSRADIARAAHADGVHLPENDLPPDAARLALSHHALCGVSVHSVEAAVQATQQGANYLVFGPIFQTSSHPEIAPVGLNALRAVVAATPLPVYAVGGINAGSTRACIEAGAHGVAVISAVWTANDVTAAVREFVVELEKV